MPADALVQLPPSERHVPASQDSSALPSIAGAAADVLATRNLAQHAFRAWFVATKRCRADAELAGQIFRAWRRHTVAGAHHRHQLEVRHARTVRVARAQSALSLWQSIAANTRRCRAAAALVAQARRRRQVHSAVRMWSRRSAARCVIQRQVAVCAKASRVHQLRHAVLAWRAVAAARCAQRKATAVAARRHRRALLGRCIAVWQAGLRLQRCEAAASVAARHTRLRAAWAKLRAQFQQCQAQQRAVSDIAAMVRAAVLRAAMQRWHTCAQHMCHQAQVLQLIVQQLERARAAHALRAWHHQARLALQREAVAARVGDLVVQRRMLRAWRARAAQLTQFQRKWQARRLGQSVRRWRARARYCKDARSAQQAVSTARAAMVKRVIWRAMHARLQHTRRLQVHATAVLQGRRARLLRHWRKQQAASQWQAAAVSTASMLQRKQLLLRGWSGLRQHVQACREHRLGVAIAVLFDAARRQRGALHSLHALVQQRKAARLQGAQQMFAWHAQVSLRLAWAHWRQDTERQVLATAALAYACRNKQLLAARRAVRSWWQHTLAKQARQLAVQQVAAAHRTSQLTRGLLAWAQFSSQQRRWRARVQALQAHSMQLRAARALQFWALVGPPALRARRAEQLARQRVVQLRSAVVWQAWQHKLAAVRVLHSKALRVFRLRRAALRAAAWHTWRQRCATLRLTQVQASGMQRAYDRVLLMAVMQRWRGALHSSRARRRAALQLGLALPRILARQALGAWRAASVAAAQEEAMFAIADQHAQLSRAFSACGQWKRWAQERRAARAAADLACEHFCAKAAGRAVACWQAWTAQRRWQLAAQVRLCESIRAARMGRAWAAWCAVARVARADREQQQHAASVCVTARLRGVVRTWAARAQATRKWRAHEQLGAATLAVLRITQHVRAWRNVTARRVRLRRAARRLAWLRQHRVLRSAVARWSTNASAKRTQRARVLVLKEQVYVHSRKRRLLQAWRKLRAQAAYQMWRKTAYTMAAQFRARKLQGRAFVLLRTAAASQQGVRARACQAGAARIARRRAQRALARWRAVATSAAARKRTKRQCSDAVLSMRRRAVWHRWAQAWSYEQLVSLARARAATRCVHRALGAWRLHAVATRARQLQAQLLAARADRVTCKRAFAAWRGKAQRGAQLKRAEAAARRAVMQRRTRLLFYVWVRATAQQLGVATLRSKAQLQLAKRAFQQFATAAMAGAAVRRLAPGLSEQLAAWCRPVARDDGALLDPRAKFVLRFVALLQGGALPTVLRQIRWQASLTAAGVPFVLHSQPGAAPVGTAPAASFLAWKAATPLLRMRRQQAELAHQHASIRRLDKAWTAWRAHVASARACQAATGRVVAAVFRIRAQAAMRAMWVQLQVSRQSKRNCARRAMCAWQAHAAEQRAEAELAAVAQRHYALVLRARAWQAWRAGIPQHGCTAEVSRAQQQLVRAKLVRTFTAWAEQAKARRAWAARVAAVGGQAWHASGSFMSTPAQRTESAPVPAAPANVASIQAPLLQDSGARSVSSIDSKRLPSGHRGATSVGSGSLPSPAPVHRLPAPSMPPSQHLVFPSDRHVGPLARAEAGARLAFAAEKARTDVVTASEMLAPARLRPLKSPTLALHTSSSSSQSSGTMATTPRELRASGDAIDARIAGLNATLESVFSDVSSALNTTRRGYHRTPSRA